MEKAIFPRLLQYAKYSIGYWGWYIFGYWASSHVYEASRSVWWLNQFGFTGLACIVIALCFLCIPQLQRGRAFDWVAALLAPLAVIGLCYASSEYASAAFIGAVILVGIVQSWQLISWGFLYRRMEAKDLFGTLMMGIVIVSLLKMIVELSPEVLIQIFFVVLPFVMVILLHRFEATYDSKQLIHARYNLKAIASFWRIAIAVIAFFIMWSLLNMVFNLRMGHFTIGALSSTALTFAAQMIDIGFGVSMLWWVFIKHRSVEWSLFWQIAFVLLAIALLIMSLFGFTQFAQVFISAAAVLAFMFVVFLLAHIARHSTYNSAVIFGFGFSCVVLVDWAVRSIVSFWGISNLDAIVVPTFLFLIIIIIVFCLPARSLSMQYLSADMTSIPMQTEDYMIIADKCKVLAEQHGLSPREREILEHLCRGRSKPYIAETLYLSENTVKTYTRRIYQKLDVHGRQELIDLVEGGKPESYSQDFE